MITYSDPKVSYSELSIPTSPSLILWIMRLTVVVVAGGATKFNVMLALGRGRLSKITFRWPTLAYPFPYPFPEIHN